MGNPSLSSRIIALRVSNEAYTVLEARAKAGKLSLGAYLRKRIEYDTLRSHHAKGLTLGDTEDSELLEAATVTELSKTEASALTEC